MKTACLFRENEPAVLVSAEEVKNGLYDRNEEFVDPEYDFKVTYVKGARNNGGPYFRLYYSYEDYKKLYPDKADRYEIVANMRHFKESKWHREWKQKFSTFCEIEKCIKNESIKKWKFADVYYDKTKTCIEIQHSYIAFDFEERNAFYSNLSIKTIWLYDLPHANTCIDERGNIEILEDNARGFFRISENPDNLKNNYVYIQVKSGLIYRVKELFRRKASNEMKSTIRYFVPTEEYTEEKFIDAIRSDKLKNDLENKPLAIEELWDDSCSWMIVKNIESGDRIFINRGCNRGMYRDFKTDCIRYKYANKENEQIPLEKRKEYSLSHHNEKRPIWILEAKGKN